MTIVHNLIWYTSELCVGHLCNSLHLYVYIYVRCWVILNKDGRLVSQGTCPTMAQIMPHLEYRDANRSVLLHLTAPGMPELVVEDPGPDIATTLVK